MKRSTLALVCALSLSIIGHATTSRNGFVESADARNVALLVGVTYGLPGIDLDLNNVREIATHPGYKFDVNELWEEEGSVSNVAKNLTDLSASVTDGGTLFFYFSGHGSKDGLLMDDRLMKIGEIRAAIEKGRAGKAPLERLVMMFDSCYSGALLNGVRKVSHQREDARASEEFANALVKELQIANGRDTYWKKLFVFASSRADETSAAGSNGSAFTVNMRKAFDEAVLAKAKVSEFVTKTQKYTASYHHPVARLVPVTLGDEALVP
jgi:hypothetical protein